MQPARQLAQLAAGHGGLIASGGQALLGLRRVVLEIAQRQLQRLPEHDEPLLCAVVQVAADPAALVVGGLDGAGARGGDLVGAGLQRALVPAALELGGGPGAEHPQRLQLGRSRVQVRELITPMWPIARPSAARSAIAR